MKYIILSAFFIATLSMSAQSNDAPVNEITEVTKTQCSKFFITPPIKNLAEEDFGENPPMKIGKDRQKREYEINPEAGPEVEDPARQVVYGSSAASVNIEVNTQGINGGFPPDPSGAIGPNHFVQAVNTTYGVYETDGSTASFPFSLSTLWSGSSNDGDPIVMYDQFVDRWFISQFQTDNNAILIAVSVTPDPQEEYYAYEFELSGFPDYPKYSIWGDAYYMSANSFGHDAVAFEREKMIAGDPTASMIAINTPNMPTGNFYSMLPADADGELPPIGTPNYFFFPGDNSWGGNSTDHIRVYEMSIDWDNPNSSSMTLSQQIDTDAFNANFTNSWNDIEQPDSNQKLDAVAGIFTYRAQYRKWINYNTVVLTMVVDLNGFDDAGIRWYELRQSDIDGDIGDWYIHQQGTYAPDDNHNRWLASASMDDFGNIAMAYSIGGEDLSASIAITGRQRWDPLGEMTIEEVIAIEGTGAQSGGNRFGDYAHMTLAPDGETFWFTGEYIANGSRRTRIISFTINDPLSTNDLTESNIQNSIYQNGENLEVKINALPSNERIQLEVFDLNGSMISKTFATPSSNSVNTSVNISGLADGAYLIRFGNENYQVVEKVVIQ